MSLKPVTATEEDAPTDRMMSLAPPLTPPAPIAVVEPQSAVERVPLAPEARARLDQQVAQFVQDITSIDVHSEDFQTRVGAIHSLGNAEMAQAASVSNRMLQRPVRTMKDGVFDSDSPISKGLIDLRNTVEKLDPAKQGNLLSPHKILGLIPFGSRIRDYFQSYESAQSHLNVIIESLYHGRDELQKDNATIEQEKVQMWALMQKIQQYIYMGKALDHEMDAKLTAMDSADPERAKVLREELLFPTRQKVMDLLTQMAVNVQGYMALDLVKRNNMELIKGVDRATTTTISALRTAVIVAQALTSQKLVLEQISALNTTTSNMIESTSAMLRQQSGEVYAQAASSTVDLQQLQKAFDNIYATMDTISDYKVKALDSMRQTVDALSTQIEKANSYLDRTRAGVVRDSVSQIASPPDAAPGIARLLPGS